MQLFIYYVSIDICLFLFLVEIGWMSMEIDRCKSFRAKPEVVRCSYQSSFPASE